MNSVHEMPVRCGSKHSHCALYKQMVISFGGDSFQFVPPNILEAAPKRGKAAHLAAQQIDNGTFDWDEWAEYDRQLVAAGYEPIMPLLPS